MQREASAGSSTLLERSLALSLSITATTRAYHYSKPFVQVSTSLSIVVPTNIRHCLTAAATADDLAAYTGRHTLQHRLCDYKRNVQSLYKRNINELPKVVAFSGVFRCSKALFN